MIDFGIFDGIIPEPAGGAHTDPMAAFPAIREHILATWEGMRNMSEEECRMQRYAKFRAIGEYIGEEDAEDGAGGAAESAKFRSALQQESNVQVPDQPPGLNDGMLAFGGMLQGLDLKDDEDLGEAQSVAEALQDQMQQNS
jgi:hypothetical protein